MTLARITTIDVIQPPHSEDGTPPCDGSAVLAALAPPGGVKSD